MFYPGSGSYLRSSMGCDATNMQRVWIGAKMPLVMSPHYERMIDKTNVPDQLLADPLVMHHFLRATNDDILHGQTQDESLLFGARCVRRTFPEFREIKLTWEKQTPPEFCTLEEL